ncbi:MAG: cupin domain-containing protein [Chloroflexi bacterium]|nr:cupin domain-containing protein [Chloroflexota bacterium]
MVQQRQTLRSERERLKMEERGDPTQEHGTYRKPRVFVKGLESLKYNLNEARANMLADIPRVLHPRRMSGIPGENTLIEPGTDPFRSQSLHVYLRTIAPGSRNEGHGHQNEALFYILKGDGWEEHDGVEWPWNEGDVVSIHNDSVHWHCNSSQTEWSESLVFKAKPMWLFMGLEQQGEIGFKPPDLDKRGPRMNYEVARRPEDIQGKVKVIKPDMVPWEWNQHGHMKKMAGTGVPLRVKATTFNIQDIPAGSRTGKRWDMGDQFVYFLEGSGYSLHWDVAVEIADQFYGRQALEPTRWEWKAGDFMWIPTNMVYQHFNTDPTTPAKFVTGYNTAFEWMGYQSVDLEPCPEWEILQAREGAAATK